MAAAWHSADSFELESTYELHPIWEAPFWAAAQRHAGAALAWLIPQAPLAPLLGGDVPKEVGRQWVDFLYAPPGRDPLVFEIDGAGHERRLDADRVRDVRLAEAGIRVVRASGHESLELDGELLNRLIADARAASKNPIDRDAIVAFHAPAVPARLALSVVEAVDRGYLPKGGPWSLEVVDSLGVVDDVAGAALDPLRAISGLWSLGVVPERVVVNGRTWSLSGASDDPPRPVRVAPLIRIRLEPETPYFAALPQTTDIPEIVVRPAGTPVNLTWLRGTTCERRMRRSAPKQDEYLLLLLQDLFGYDSFREHQEASVRQVLGGGDSVVLHPTGSGKSLIYQLAGLLMPGTTLVVDPLVSLIDDQERRLKQVGIERVVALHAARGGGPRERDDVLGQLASGDAHFVFVTPERFQSQRFRDNLRESSRDQLINLAVVDEAHTVSEWGHDFRTSYLRLARNIRHLCRDHRGGWPPLLALTGTASPAVQRDVFRDLEIDAAEEGALQKPTSHDRPKLEYRKVSGPDEDWLKLVKQALVVTVPAELKVKVADIGLLQGEKTMAGIIFCPWTRAEHGVVRIRDAAASAMRDSGVEITADIYSGGAPIDTTSPRDWAAARATAARKFIANETSLLVATKAFGMGIDKPNIRYTIHAGFPSSIEAFAQEAGRAGRDGQLAVCILAAALPSGEILKTATEDELWSFGGLKKQLSKARDKDGGDLSRQYFFLSNSYPGVADEAKTALQTYKWMRRRGGPGATVVVPVGRRPRDSDRAYENRRKKADRALYRLAAIGVVDDVTVDGPELTVRLADFSAESVDGAFLAYASRIEPGKEGHHRLLVATAPADLDERVGLLLAELVRMVYRIVAEARVAALRHIYDLASGPDDPKLLRRKINAYLGDGPAAVVLGDAVTTSPIDIRRFIQDLEQLPSAEASDLSGAVERQLESYPNHPLLVFAAALAVSREPQGSEPQFREHLESALKQMEHYEINSADAAAAAGWLIQRLWEENAGRRWLWAATVWEALEGSPFWAEPLVDVESVAFARAIDSRFDPRELTLIASRRLARHGTAAANLAAKLADTANPPDSEE
jgi:ATP-dependent DNA helicase RecQ